MAGQANRDLLSWRQGNGGSNPLGSWNSHALAEQPRVLATLSRWRSWVRIPSRALAAETARWAGRHNSRAYPLPACGLEARSCYRRSFCVGWALAGPRGCRPRSSGLGGSTPSRRTERSRPGRLPVGTPPHGLGKRDRLPSGLRCDRRVAEWQACGPQSLGPPGRGHRQGRPPGRGLRPQPGWTGFDSLRPCCRPRPRSVMDGTRPSEGRRPGSTPGEGSPCGCGGCTVAFGAARTVPTPGRGREGPRGVGERTRPCEGRGPGSTPGEDISKTPEPDGQATGCNPVEVGSTPTGVSRGGPPAAVRFSGKRLTSSGPRRTGLASRRSARRVPCRGSEPGRCQVAVAQRLSTGPLPRVSRVRLPSTAPRSAYHRPRR